MMQNQPFVPHNIKLQCAQYSVLPMHRKQPLEVVTYERSISEMISEIIL